MVSYFASRDRGRIIALIAAVFAVYLPFWGNPFFFDDIPFFYGGVAENYAHTWIHFPLRWISYATLAWTEVWFSNVATHTYHLGNVLIHAANVILLFFLLREIVVVALPVSPESRSVLTWGAWLGAMIFALHPVAVFAVGYVVQRSILLATFFVLVMQLTYLRGLMTGKALWLGLSVCSYFLAVFSKEHSVMIPAIILILTILARDRLQASRAVLSLAWLGFVAVGILIILRARGVFGIPYEPMAAALFEQQGAIESTPVLHMLSIMTQAGLFFKYLLLWLIPNPAWMSVDMREQFVASLAAWQGWVGAGLFVVFGFAGIALLRGGGVCKLVGFALLYPWLQFILEFSTVRVQESFVLYRSYIWMPGLMMLVTLAVMKWSSRKTIAIFTAIALMLSIAAVNRLWIFADSYRLWDDVVRLLPDGSETPGADRIYFNRAQALEAHGRIQEAIEDLRQSLAISPQYAPVHFELGWLYLVSKEYDEAMIQFDQAITIDPEFARAYYGKALIMKVRHENEQAKALMEKSCQLEKQSVACLIAHGRIESSQSN